MLFDLQTFAFLLLIQVFLFLLNHIQTLLFPNNIFNQPKLINNKYEEYK